MLTVIRTTPGRIKYCGRTIDNLIESNGPDDHEIHVVCSSSRTPNQNGLEAIRKGVELCGGKPFCFLEDDLAFIRRFNNAATQFAHACDGADVPFLPLCAAYHKSLDACRGIAWRYPLKDFYGTQAFVMEPAKALGFYEWAMKNPKLPRRGFDLLIKDWAIDHGFFHALTPQRCFVQHLGVESSLHNGRFHHYAAWPGSDYEWRTGAFAVAEQKNRPCDRPLVQAIAQWFADPKMNLHDVGCSTGQYLQEFRKLGFKNAAGYDVTPGIENPPILEVDFSRLQEFTAKKGNVICLEVAEHIHPENELDFLCNIQRVCDEKLVLSWALPGQGGRRHVNERDASYVTAALAQMGFGLDSKTTTTLRESATISWFRQSLYAFRRKA